MRFNFEGWNFKEWISGYKVKDIVKFLLPFITLWITTGSFWMSGVGAVIGKPILDLIHYWITE